MATTDLIADNGGTDPARGTQESMLDILAEVDAAAGGAAPAEEAPDSPGTAAEEESFEPASTPVPVEIDPESGLLSFTTKRFVLLALFTKAGSVLPTKDILPVLKNFQLELADGRLRVVATDLELSVISTTEMVTTEAEGRAVFPGKRLLSILQEAGDGEMRITVRNAEAGEGQLAHITSERTEWDLTLMDGSDYPPLPDVSQVEMHEVDRARFLGAISAVRYAAATDTVRPNLMMIDVFQGKMRAADGVRFQQADLNHTQKDEDDGPSVDFPLDIQIPIGAVDDLVKLLRSTDQPTLAIGETDFHLVFRIGADVFIANKMVVSFPNIEQQLLKPALANDQELVIDRGELTEAVKRVRITADEETSAVILDLSAGKCTLRSADKMNNTCTEEIDAGWDSPPRRVVVNHGFLLDMLSMADVKTCHIFFGPETKTRRSPVLLRDDDSGMVGIINQMRADWTTD